MNAPFVTPYDVETIRAEFPILSQTGLRQAARLSRQRRLGAEAARGDRRHGAHHGDRLLERAPRPALHGERRDRGLRGRARGRAALPQRPLDRRDRVHEIGDRGLQPRRQLLRHHGARRGRRDHPLDHGAPFEHRALALPARAQRGGDQMGAGRRRRQLPPRRVREAVLAEDQDGRDHAHVERARHGDAGKRDRAHRPRAWRAGAPRRRPGGGAPLGRRAGARLRLLRHDRPQALRPDRDRRALRQARMAREDAALPGRRRDDQRGPLRGHHLQRAAAPLRGRHAADRRGDRASAPRCAS